MLNIYKIDVEYNKYLQVYDKNVTKNYDEKEGRPYVGLLIQINDIFYFAPLTSPKEKFKHMKNSVDFIKIKNGEYGAINFNNMIPAKEEYANPIIIKDEKDTKYKNLLNNQYEKNKKNEEYLITKAKKLLDLYTKEIKGTGLNISILVTPFNSVPFMAIINPVPLYHIYYCIHFRLRKCYSAAMGTDGIFR